MRTTILLVVVLVGLGREAGAHGGIFRGPPGGVPPGLREPFDPEPPPPPPTDPDDPPPVITPSDDPPDVITPHETGGPESGTTAPVQPLRPDTAAGRRTRTGVLTYESWRFWWAYNNADILNLRARPGDGTFASADPRHYASRDDRTNRRNAQRPTDRAVLTTVVPALVACIDRPEEQEDVHGGALVALGKVGTEEHIRIFAAVLDGTYRNARGRAVRFGLQATESAALALGLLPDLDASGKDAVRRVCLATLRNESMRTRERCWAAVALGLQRDRDAVEDLAGLLRPGVRYPDVNVPAGILCALGLIGDRSVLDDLVRGFVHGDLFGRDIASEDRLRAFAGYALAKIGDPRVVPDLITVLRSRSRGRLLKRSAAIALGVLGARADDGAREDAGRALCRYIRTSGGDTTGENFALIALSRIGTPQAFDVLLDAAENGNSGQRAFAALGLGTRIFYDRRAAGDGSGQPVDPALDQRVRQVLARVCRRVHDQDTKAAFLLARGLVRDLSARAELVGIVARRGGPPDLRAYGCVALGLLGEASADVKDALRLALAERTSPDLRRSAAIGFALLRDAAAVDLLLAELAKSTSFAVQAQLVTALGTIGDAKAIPPLLGILEDARRPVQVRAMAAVGLGLIGDRLPLPALARLSRDYNYRASTADLDELLHIL